MEDVCRRDPGHGAGGQALVSMFVQRAVCDPWGAIEDNGG
jgi:hypothetical protein